MAWSLSCDFIWVDEQLTAKAAHRHVIGLSCHPLLQPDVGIVLHRRVGPSRPQLCFLHWWAHSYRNMIEVICSMLYLKTSPGYNHYLLSFKLFLWGKPFDIWDRFERQQQWKIETKELGWIILLWIHHLLANSSIYDKLLTCNESCSFFITQKQAHLSYIFWNANPANRVPCMILRSEHSIPCIICVYPSW